MDYPKFYFKNYSKTKEMLTVPLLKLNVPGLDIDDNIIESFWF